MSFKKLKKTIRYYEGILSSLEIKILKKRVNVLDIDDVILKNNYYLSLLAEYLICQKRESMR